MQTKSVMVAMPTDATVGINSPKGVWTRKLTSETKWAW